MTDLTEWPALVLTAGLGTRLRPLTEVRAKAAMPVAGSTMVVRILRWLQAAGVRRVVLNLHHKPETITAAVGDGSHLGLAVRYSWEPVVLGSAGGPRRALPLLDAERFLIVNGDTLTDCDLAAVARQHVEHRARVTMAVVEGDVHRYGGVLLDRDARVRGFGKADRDARARHFIGVQAVESGVFADLPDNEPTETVKTLYPRLLRSDRDAIRAYESDAEFLDVGTARDYFATVETIAAREGRAFDIGEGCQIADDAVVERSVLWDRVTVGRGARLAHCIVADDVIIPDGAHYENRVLMARKDAASPNVDASQPADSASSVDRSDSVYSVDL
ncbi:MAG TPA: NDP-sugar synthase [Vicinamibacterales bacterium]|nr:NDP-sugar synthase [Vicinamibacterales bacterium]